MRNILFLLILFSATATVAQDLAGLSLKEQPQLSGSIRLGSNFYNYSGTGAARNTPFAANLAGNINASFGQINVPLSFSISRRQSSLSVPFNMYGLSPYYKWVKLHLGHRMLGFSPYVFSGKAFFGAGIELTPGIFRVTAFSGKIRNIFALQEINGPGGPLALPSYDRRIAGAKIGVGGKGAGLELMGIKVKDDTGTPDPEGALQPMENVVLGTKTWLRFFKTLSFETNLSASLFSANLLAGGAEEAPAAIDNFAFLLDPNISTRLSFAGDASLQYSKKGLTAGLKYRRIEPFFQSFGINFLQNDVENYTANLAVPLLKRRLQFNGSFGLQRDNLRNNKAFRSNRAVGSLAANFTPNKKLNLLLRYANYQHENQSGLIEVNDTLRFVTVTQSLFAGARMQLYEKANTKAVWSINGFRNQVVNESGINDINANFIGAGINSNLLLSLKETDWSFGPTFNFNRFEFYNRTQGRTGGGITISKSLFKKSLYTAATALYNVNRLNRESDGNHLNFSLLANLRLQGGHSLAMRWYWINNSALLNSSFRELRGNLTYTYSLNPRRS